MSVHTTGGAAARSEELFRAACRRNHGRLDRVFALLLVAQGLIASGLVLHFAPDGVTPPLTLHLRAVFLLCIALTAFPALLAVCAPGRLQTRLSITVGQALLSMLVVHLAGGRVDPVHLLSAWMTLLALYREPRLLVVATGVIALDLVAHGALGPRVGPEIAGVVARQSIQHAVWLLFQLSFLLAAIRWAERESRAGYWLQAELDGFHAAFAAAKEPLNLALESAPVYGAPAPDAAPAPSAHEPPPCAEELTVAPAPVARPYRALVVRDDPVHRQSLAMMLRQLGCKVELAANGEEALWATCQGALDVVFVDCEMPHLDGYALTRALRASTGSLAFVPIIGLAAESRAVDRERCLEAGMDDVLDRPVELAGLTTTLDRWVPPVFDDARLDALSRDVGPELVVELIELFNDNAATEVARLRAASACGDLAGVQRVAHALKGAALQIGATGAAHVARELERVATRPALYSIVLERALAREVSRVRHAAAPVFARAS